MGREHAMDQIVKPADYWEPQKEMLNRSMEQEMNNPTVPTEEEFRATGWTKNAINFPISEAAVKVRCSYNGITIEQAPKTWWYAPNAWVQADLEKKAAAL